MAFAGTPVKQVLLPYTLRAIGHKAFYACDDLRLVTFTSFNAPILEEEFDAAYHESLENIPGSGDYTFQYSDGSTIIKKGIGITKYFMWNAEQNYHNTYYGATFTDYVGHVDTPITMVRPVNGNHYDSFIFAQYFDTLIDGSAAADEITLAAIAAINAIPDSVTLDDKALVEAARAAYDKISTKEQQALVTNYADLISAEQRITALTPAPEGEQTEETAPTEPAAEKTEGGSGGVIVAVVILLAAGGAGWMWLKKRKVQAMPEVTEATEEVAEEAPAAEAPAEEESACEEVVEEIIIEETKE